MNLQTKEQMVNKVMTSENVSNPETELFLRHLLSRDLSEINKFCLFDEKTLKNVNAISLYAKNINEKTIRLNINKSTEIESNDIESLISQLCDEDLQIIQSNIYKARASISLQLYNENPTNLLCPKAKTTIEKFGPYVFENIHFSESIWKGPIKLSDSCVYLGEWNEKNQPEGKGAMYYTNGEICEGTWKAGKLHGKGRKIYASGSLYLGDWVNGDVEGYGILIYFDESKFEGNFRNGKKNGQGKCFWTDGSYYEGGWVNNNREGVGKCVWSTGDEYEGEWKNDKLNGKGKFKWSFGRYHDGYFVNSKKEGYGIWWR